MASPLQHTAFVYAIAGFLFVGFAAPGSQGNVPPQSPAADASAFHAFDEAVARYMTLHTRLRTEVPGPKPQSSAADVSAASDMLAAAVRRARPRARPGDFFDATATQQIRQRFRDELGSPTSTVSIAAIDDERPVIRHPRIHQRFPVDAEMATMPPSLLRLLPILPIELEYRLVGDYLVLRDVKAALVLDYISDAVRATQHSSRRKRELRQERTGQ